MNFSHKYRFPFLFFILCSFLLLNSQAFFLYAQCPSKIDVADNCLRIIWEGDHEKPAELQSIEVDGKTFSGSFDKVNSWKTKSNSIFSSQFLTKEHKIVVFGVSSQYVNGKYIEPEMEYLISFNGTNVDNQILMTWIVMKGSSHKEYQIELRLKDKWIPVDTIQATNFKTKASSVFIFEYLDKTPPTGDLVYRVKSVKMNNKFSYSDLVSISNFGGKQARLTSTDPLYRFEKETSFEVFTDKGDLLFKGSGQWIDFSEIRKGIYSIKYKGNTTKVIYN